MKCLYCKYLKGEISNFYCDFEPYKIIRMNVLQENKYDCKYKNKEGKLTKLAKQKLLEML